MLRVGSLSVAENRAVQGAEQETNARIAAERRLSSRAFLAAAQLARMIPPFCVRGLFELKSRCGGLTDVRYT
jgi:hypothetical protein